VGVVPFDFEITATVLEEPAACYLFNLEDLIERFGERNVREASNRDNVNGAINLITVQQAMDYACNQIHNALPLYEVPLVFADNVVSPTVKEWAMVICFENMFGARGDDDKGNNPYRKLVDNVYKEMSLYGTPIRSLTATKRSIYTFVPVQE
jgi:phage gp36-like protein